MNMPVNSTPEGATKDLDAARTMIMECLCFRSRRTTRIITRAYDEALRPTGLQSTQLTLLNTIAMGPAGGQPMRDLAEILALEVSTLTRNLRALERVDLVEIGRCDKDRRVRVARLTDQGIARLAQAVPYWKQAQERVIQALGADAARALALGLDHAAQAMTATDDSATPQDAAP